MSVSRVDGLRALWLEIKRSVIVKTVLESSCLPVPDIPVTRSFEPVKVFGDSRGDNVDQTIVTDKVRLPFIKLSNEVHPIFNLSVSFNRTPY